MKLLKGKSYRGIDLGLFYIGYQFNVPLFRLLRRVALHGRHSWIGPFYIVIKV